MRGEFPPASQHAVSESGKVGTTAYSGTTLRGYFGGLGNPLPGKLDDCTLKAGQTPIGLGVSNE
ncbi:MAG TPA: hypothetical protein VKO18_03215 [Terriglobia bacterium]|nr:hypothetical protein [Terriglobia bacterium]